VNNGLLPARVTDADWNALSGAAGDAQIDLEQGVINISTTQISFALEDSWRVKLINGWDDIDLTKQHTAQIAAYKTQRHQSAPWAWPTHVD
jgi:3-isopropylmalate/(R)-2-methylmalate dehydratase small subunit